MATDRGIRIAALAIGMTLLGDVGSVAAECNRFALQIATDPVPYQHVHGLEKASALLAGTPPAADAIHIGDSLVEFWPEEMITRQFPAQRVWNIGVGGGETQTTLWLIDQIRAPVLRPKRLLVLVGTNNLTHPAMPACAIAAGIKAVVMAAHAKWPKAKIDVMGIPPRGRDFRFRDKDRLAVNAAVKNWSAAEPNVRYFEVDAQDMTCSQYNSRLKVAGTGKSAIVKRCANYADDFGHFQRPGYAVIVAAMPKN